MLNILDAFNLIANKYTNDEGNDPICENNDYIKKLEVTKNDKAEQNM